MSIQRVTVMFAIQAAGRSATRQLRYDVNNLINNAASDMSVHWNKTNRAFTDRLVLRLRPCDTHIVALQDQRMPGRTQKSQVEPDPDEECK